MYWDDEITISQMNVEAQEKGYVLRFPDVHSMGGRPETVSGRHGSRAKPTENGPLYLSFTNHPADVAPHPTAPTTDSFEQFHPTNVALDAFREHHGLVISPENIGAQLVLDFGEYVNQNLEQCASIFNGKLGEKKEIKARVELDETLTDVSILERAVREWQTGVLRETNPLIREVLHPTFSTQNQVTDIVYGGLLMGAAKEFFDFSFGTLCGIPEIAVEGTKEDWEQIGAMAYGLSQVKELSELRPFYDWVQSTIVNSIVDLYEGREDLNFWTSVARHRSGSGSQGASSGWLPSLSLYRAKGELLNQDARWTHRDSGYQLKHLCVAVTQVTLIADERSSGGKPIDPSLTANFGFVSANYRNDRLRPVLGVDAYVTETPEKWRL